VFFLIGIAPLLHVGGAPNPLEPEHAQEGSILEGAQQRPTEANEAKCPLPPTVAEHPYDDRPQGDGEEQQEQEGTQELSIHRMLIYLLRTNGEVDCLQWVYLPTRPFVHVGRVCPRKGSGNFETGCQQREEDYHRQQPQLEEPHDLRVSLYQQSLPSSYQPTYPNEPGFFASRRLRAPWRKAKALTLLALPSLTNAYPLPLVCAKAASKALGFL